MKKVIILTGPTASNKTTIAHNISIKKRINIINADSKQIYKEIPITTSQPHPITNSLHKLYGYTTIKQQYSVADWLKDVVEAIDESIQQNITPLVVGGSGMYIDALVNGLFAYSIPKEKKTEFILEYENKTTLELYEELKQIDPIATSIVNSKDSYRIKNALFVKKNTGQSIYELHKNTNMTKQWNFVIYTTMPSKEKNYEDINNRTIKMIENGMIEEIKNILEHLSTEGVGPNAAKKIIGISEIIQYIQNIISIDDAIKLIQQKTRNYAKRQCTWIRNRIKNAITISQSSSEIDI